METTIEDGVRLDLERMKIRKPYPALVTLALEIARKLDNGVEEKSLSALSRELRLTLEDIRNMPTGSDTDPVEEIQNRNK